MSRIQNTANKISDIMQRLEAHILSACKGPNGSKLEFWQVGKQTVIVQYWESGGCTHYTENMAYTYEAMEKQLARLVKEG